MDSHTFVWFVSGDAQCSQRAQTAIEEAESVYFSAVTAWEMATKVRIGKWPSAEPYLLRLDEVIQHFAFLPLPITVEDGRRAGQLSGSHKDPFDRILAAQAQSGDMFMATADEAFQTLGTRTLW